MNGMLRVMRYILWMLLGIGAALVLFVCLLPWRKRRMGDRGLTSGTGRELVLLVLFLFSGGMAVLTLCPEPGWLWSGLRYGYWTPFFGDQAFPLAHRVNLIPFSQGDSLFNIAGNVVMFLPFGFLAALLFRGWTWKRALALGLAVTAGIECWQIAVGRFFDIDDIILNAFGVLCGYWLRLGLQRLAPGFTERFRCGAVQSEDEHG